MSFLCRYLYLALAYFTPAVVAITDSSDPARKETGKAQPQLLEAFGALGLRVLVVGWLLLLTTKSAAHLKNFSQDELLLKECIRFVPLFSPLSSLSHLE